MDSRFSRPIFVAVLVLAAWGPPAGAQVIVPDTSVGYIDTAIVADQVRFRFDAGYGVDFPSRAEFFYAKSGSFATRPPNDPLFDPDAQGPPLRETNVDYQDFTLNFEKTVIPGLSGFAELPMRLVNPEVNDNTGGLADMNAGLKLALIQDCNQLWTFQFRTYIPTGDSNRALGTHHVSLEPALLGFHRLSERMNLECELRDWIAVRGSDFAGNVLRYGVGLSYNLPCGEPCCQCGGYHSGTPTFAPVFEVVGWTVLEGRNFDPSISTTETLDAAGDTIVNLKFGVRYRFNTRDQVYAGYGHAVTDDVWYQDILRVEYRRFF